MTNPTGYSIDYPELTTVAVMRMTRNDLLKGHKKAVKVIVDLFSEVACAFTGDDDWPKMRNSVRDGIIDALTAARVSTESVEFGLSDSDDPDNGVSISFPEALSHDDGIVITDRGTRCLLFHTGPEWGVSKALISDLHYWIDRHSSTQPGMTFTQSMTPYGVKYPRYKRL